ncbi:hypothetical protein KIW84_057644 [Lathyrus oleraceus]|uniref:Uncharacterized protein n=1 Tax=Pisum sativum TaxID=3888 RepID=A0A9D4X3P5_PEA|nr:hypothetical protein KIW84_057644 [Pisum sativum]
MHSLEEVDLSAEARVNYCIQRVTGCNFGEIRWMVGSSVSRARHLVASNALPVWVVWLDAGPDGVHGVLLHRKTANEQSPVTCAIVAEETEHVHIS